MRTPRWASISAPSASNSGPRRGSSRSSTFAAISGTGTSRLRSSLGRERIRATTSSDRNAGTSHSNPAARSCGSTFSGTCTVTPSCALPGSKRYDSFSSSSPWVQTSGRPATSSAAAGLISSSRVKVSRSGRTRRSSRHQRSKCAPETMPSGIRAA